MSVEEKWLWHGIPCHVSPNLGIKVSGVALARVPASKLSTTEHE
jgi:hypothetical protein